MKSIGPNLINIGKALAKARGGKTLNIKGTTKSKPSLKMGGKC